MIAAEALPASSNGVPGLQPVVREGMGYTWSVSEHEIQMRADYITARADEVNVELTVTRRGRHLYLARFNTTSATSRGTLVRALDKATDGMRIPWERLVEQFSVAVLRLERQGEQTQYTAKAPRRPVRYLVDSLIIEGKTNSIFGPGGSGKGYLCVGLCCALASRVALGDLSVMEARPVYLDWEDDFETFQERLNRVALGFGVDVPRIPYRRMRGTVPDRINEVARILSDEGATCVFIDSFSAAGGTKSERQGWDEIAHRFFDACNLIPDMTWLLIDHVASDNLKDPVGKAYGSIQKMNRLRNAWELRSDQEPGADIVHIKLFDAKWNHVGRRKPLGVQMHFRHDGGVEFMSEDPVARANKPMVSVATKMGIQLAAKPMDTPELARVLKTSESTIRSVLHRESARFERDEDGLIHIRRETMQEQAGEDESGPSGSGEDLPW